MNTRLEIASRVLSGMLANDRNEHTIEVNAQGAVAFADALIAAEERTRKPTTPNHVTIADRVEILRSNVFGMMGDNESRIVQLNKIVGSLDAILEDARGEA